MAVVAVMALAMPLAARADTTPYPARVLPGSLGMNAQFMDDTIAVTTPAEKEAAAAGLAAQGIRTARVIAQWRRIEPDPPIPGLGHTYKWAHVDAYMVNLASHAIRAEPIFGGSPRWATALGPADQFNNLGSNGWVPLDPKQFGEFLAAWAGRYGPGGTFWQSHPELTELPPLVYEVWNEPNVNGYFTNPAGGSCPLHQVGNDMGPKFYADLYAAAHAAVRAAHPGAVVLVGGLAGHTVPRSNSDMCTVQEFLAGMKAHRPDLEVDAIGIHVYRATPQAALDQLVEIRTQIDALGWPSALPIYLNESGWHRKPSIDDWAVEDDVRGTYLAQTADRALRSNCGIRQYQVHTWLTPDTPGTEGYIQNWFGVGNFDGTAKPSGAAYGVVTRTLQGEGPLPANPATEYLCPWRGEPDIDGDGVVDSADAFPADPARGATAPVVPEVPAPVLLVMLGTSGVIFGLWRRRAPTARPATVRVVVGGSAG